VKASVAQFAIQQRDEDFDESYESLLSLAATIGEMRPRHTPDSVISLLPIGTFKEWRNSDTTMRITARGLHLHPDGRNSPDS
jgi:phosphate uptake regulator